MKCLLKTVPNQKITQTSFLLQSFHLHEFFSTILRKVLSHLSPKGKLSFSSDFYTASGPTWEWKLDFGDQKARELSNVPSRDTKLNLYEKEKTTKCSPLPSQLSLTHTDAHIGNVDTSSEETKMNKCNRSHLGENRWLYNMFCESEEFLERKKIINW